MIRIHDNARKLLSSTMGKGLILLKGTCFTRRY